MAARTRVWISALSLPGSIDSKIKSKHDLTSEDVYDALVCQNVPGDDDIHPVYGHRKVVWAKTFSGQPFKAYLYIVDEQEGHYRLGSAYDD